MASNLLAAFNGGRALQHILPFHDNPRRSWSILLPDLQKDTLQPLFSLLSLVIREEVQLHIARLQVACDDAKPADKQARIDFPIEGIYPRLSAMICGKAIRPAKRAAFGQRVQTPDMRLT